MLSSNKMFSFIRSNALFLAVLLALNVFILSLLLKRNEFENGVYYNYLKSILNNGDFNIFTQFQNHYDQWMVTATYNHFDYHSPFFSSLLFLPFVFFQVFYFVHNESYIFFGQQLFVSLLLLLPILARGIFLENQMQKNSFLKLAVAIAIANGGAWCFFLEPSELSFIQLIFSLIIFYELYLLLDNKTKTNYILPMAIGCFSILKADGLFYVVPVLFVLLLAKDIKSTIRVFVTVVLCQSQLLLVNFIRHGELFLKNPILMNFDHHNYFWYCFFGTNGWFTKSPLLFLIFILMCYQVLFEKFLRDRLLILTGLLILLFKALLIGTGIVPVGDYYANRMIITETPFYAYSALLLFLQYPKLKSILKFALVMFVVWGIYTTMGWGIDQSQFDFRLVSFLSPTRFYTALLQAGDSFFSLWLGFKFHYKAVIMMSFISAAFLGINLFLHDLNPQKYRTYFLVLFISISMTFSLLNVLNNASNVDKMKTAGVFNRAVVLRGSAIYYDEVLDILNFGRKISIQLGKTDKNWMNDFQAKYISEVLSNIVYDPTSFSDDLRKGIIRPSFWQLKD